MILFRTCAAVLSMILVLQTGCDLWCHENETEGAALTQAAAAPACHGTTEKSDGSEQKPIRHHESAKECVHPQAADDNSKLQTKIVKASHPVAAIEFTGVLLRMKPHTMVYGFSNIDSLKVSPPSSLILRI